MTASEYLDRAEVIALGFASLGGDVLIHRNAHIVGPGNLSIGSHVRIDGFTTLVCADAGCSIGDHVHVSSYVMLVGAAASPWRTSAVCRREFACSPPTTTTAATI